MIGIHLLVTAAIEIPLHKKSADCKNCPSESISRLLLITSDSMADEKKSLSSSTHHYANENSFSEAEQGRQQVFG